MKKRDYLGVMSNQNPEYYTQAVIVCKSKCSSSSKNLNMSSFSNKLEENGYLGVMSNISLEY